MEIIKLTNDNIEKLCTKLNNFCYYEFSVIPSNLREKFGNGLLCYGFENCLYLVKDNWEFTFNDDFTVSIKHF